MSMKIYKTHDVIIGMYHDQVFTSKLFYMHLMPSTCLLKIKYLIVHGIAENLINKGKNNQHFKLNAFC